MCTCLKVALNFYTAGHRAKPTKNRLRDNSKISGTNDLVAFNVIWSLFGPLASKWGEGELWGKESLECSTYIRPSVKEYEGVPG